MILLFLFGVKKKKLTKRKNTGFRFEAAPEPFVFLSDSQQFDFENQGRTAGNTGL